MKCNCPHCSAAIEMGDPGNSEKGDFGKCPECSKQVWRNREQFILRAYKKEGKVFCSHCGGELGADTVCRCCASPFPDYWVVHTSKPARSRPGAPAFSLAFPVRKEKPRAMAVPGIPRTSKSPAFKGLSFDLSGKKKALGILGCALMFVVAAALGYKVYLDKQAESAFSGHFIRALYGIKSGSTRALTGLNALVQGTNPTDKDLADFNEVKGEIDKIRTLAGEPPERFREVADKASAVYGVYVKINTLALASRAPTPELPEQIRKLETELGNAERNLKQALPADLAKDVREAANKYRSLRYLTD